MNERAIERIAAIEREEASHQDKVAKELARLRKIVEAPDLRPYSLENPPKHGERYWYMRFTGNPARTSWDDTGFDHDCLAIGNCFRTRKEALAHGEKMRYASLIKNVGEPPSDTQAWLWARAPNGDSYRLVWTNSQVQILMWRVGLIAATKEELA